MRVQKLTMLNGVNSYKNYSTNPQFHKFAQVNFSAGNDEFVKGTENAFEITGRTLKKSLKEALQKASQTSSSLNISDQIDRINTNNENIAQISEKYKILNNTIENALKKGNPKKL